MAKILITSGPTRQYLDPVRYLSNASSGRMGRSLARAAIGAGHEVTVVTGPVSVDYPPQCDVVRVVTTDEMMTATASKFQHFDGLIGAAAPCDYRPTTVQSSKMTKTGDPIEIELVETPDIVATLGGRKRDDQWVVGFALETEDRRFRATVKLQRKCCDLIVSNGPSAIDADDNEIEIIDPRGEVLLKASGQKDHLGKLILFEIERRLIVATPLPPSSSPVA